MRFLPFIFLILLSCNSEKKLQKSIKRLNDNPIESAKYCADKYPVKDTIIIDSTKFDTLYVGEYIFDTTYVDKKDTVVKYITKTLPEKVITKTVTKEILRENTARVEQFREQYISCEKKYSSLFLEKEKVERDLKAMKG